MVAFEEPMDHCRLSSDDIFAKVAVGGEFLNDKQLCQARMLQKLVLKRSGKHMGLGKILLALGVVEQEQLDAIERLQKAMEAELAAEGRKPDHGAESGDEQRQERDFELKIAEDYMQAWIKVPPGNPGGIDLARVKKELDANSVVFGLLDDETIEAYLEDPDPEQPLLIARGLEPVAGEAMEIVYHFDTDPMRVGTLKEDGTMDWKDRGALPMVKEGDLLAEKVTPREGQPGKDILGQEVAPPKIKDIILRCGRGVERSSDGRKAFAKIGGSPRIGPDGKLLVISTYTVNGDIGLETGHVDFSGLIDVTGTVQTGFRVKGHGLRAGEIQAAEIELEGDLICLGGIYGARIGAGGKVRVSHIHDSRIVAVGDIVVEREIFDSDIETNGRCIIGGGNIIGSRISAKKGIQVMNVGTEAAKASTLTVGIDKMARRKIDEYKQRLAVLEDSCKELENELETLREKYEKAGTELGEVAQEQDRCMVEKRKLEEQMAKDEKTGRLVEDSVREKIAGLDRKYHDLDARVAELMDREDDFKGQITVKTGQLEKMVAEQTRIQGRIEKVMADSRQDRAVPIIKVSGIIYSKTKIEGPHATMVLEEDQRHIRIAEIKEGGKGKMSIYALKITPLR